MRIVLMADHMESGGAETHIATLAEGLAANGHRVLLLSCGGMMEKMLLTCFPPDSPASSGPAGIQIRHFPAPLNGRGVLRNLSFLCRVCREFQADVLHAHTRRTAFLLRLLPAAFFFSPPPPLTFPDGNASAERPPIWRMRSLRRLARPLRVVTAHARFAPRCRRLSYWGESTIAVSGDLKEHLVRAFGRDPRSITVIPNGIDPARFYPPRPSSPSAPGWADGVLRITFASRMDRDCSQGARLLLALLPLWQKYGEARGVSLRLTLAGGGECREDIQAKADRLGRRFTGGPCPTVIRVPGRITDMASLLRDTDLLIGVSRVALEGWFCGADVILCGDEGFGGWVIPGTERFRRLSAGNFCCRGEEKATAWRLHRAFCRWLAQRYPAEASAGMREPEPVDGDAPAPGAIPPLRQTYPPCLAPYTKQAMTDATERLYRKQRFRRPLRLLIAGYGGCGNLGDDAILRRWITDLHGRPAPATLCCPGAIFPAQRPGAGAEALLPTVQVTVTLGREALAPVRTSAPATDSSFSFFSFPITLTPGPVPVRRHRRPDGAGNNRGISAFGHRRPIRRETVEKCRKRQWFSTATWPIVSQKERFSAENEPSAVTFSPSKTAESTGDFSDPTADSPQASTGFPHTSPQDVENLWENGENTGRSSVAPTEIKGNDGAGPFTGPSPVPHTCGGPSPHPTVSQGSVPGRKFPGSAGTGQARLPCPRVPPVRTVSRLDMIGLWRAMGHADAMLLGGGCLLQNVSGHGNRSLGYYLGLLGMARLRGCPAVLAAAGVGPILGAGARQATAAALRTVREMTVRDGGSLRLASELGAHPLGIQQDPAWGTRPLPARGRRTTGCPEGHRDLCPTAPLQATGGRAGTGPAPPYCCILPRPAGGKKDTDGVLCALSSVVRRLWEERGWMSVILPMDRRQDTGLCYEVCRRAGTGQVWTVYREEALMNILAQSCGVLSMRLHGLIFARLSGVPAVALSYDDRDGKLQTYAAEHGVPFLKRGTSADAIAKIMERESTP